MNFMDPNFCHIVLVEYTPSSMISRIIKWFTKSNFTHVMIYCNGALWDSSEKRGDFGAAKLEDYRDRKAHVYQTGVTCGSAADWINGMIGRKYYYQGILGWVLHTISSKFDNLSIRRSSKFYCFESARDFLLEFGYNDASQDKYLSGDSIVRILDAGKCPLNISGAFIKI